MAIRVKRDDIIEGLEFQSDESHSFLEKRTREVVSISDEEIQAAEDDEPIEDFPDWQQDLVGIAKEIDDLYSSIKGSDSFRRIKDAINEYDIADDWYKYRNDALKEIDIEWCQAKGIEFDEQ